MTPLPSSPAALFAAVALVTVIACHPPEDQRRAIDADSGSREELSPLGLRCAHQIWGGVIHEYPWRRQSVIVGPIALWPARAKFPHVPERQLRPVVVTGRGPRFASDQLKLQIIIEQNERALLAIGQTARESAAFLFRTEYRRRGFRISEGVSSLKLRGCPGRGHYTEYSTALIVDGPRCLPIEVTVAAQPGSIEAVLPIGRTDCPER